jgi:hypothetical protein
MADIAPALPVRKTVVVNATQARAFEVFKGFDSWWPLAEGPTRTRVELEHRGLERSAFAEELRSGIDSPQGWDGLLAMFAEAAQKA